MKLSRIALLVIACWMGSLGGLHAQGEPNWRVDIGLRGYYSNPIGVGGKGHITYTDLATGSTAFRREGIQLHIPSDQLLHWAPRDSGQRCVRNLHGVQHDVSHMGPI